MSDLCEFVFGTRKLTVRDSVKQIGNNTSKSEASIESRTALNAGDTENVLQLEVVQQGEHRETGTSSRRRCQYQEGKEARECCNNTQNKANRCFCTTILFKSRDWYSTGHGSHIPRLGNRNGQLSVIANIETDAQTECNQGTVDKFEAFHDELIDAKWRSGAEFSKSPRMREDGGESRHFCQEPCGVCTRAVVIVVTFWNGQDAIDQAWKR